MSAWRPCLSLPPSHGTHTSPEKQKTWHWAWTCEPTSFFIEHPLPTTPGTQLRLRNTHFLYTAPPPPPWLYEKLRKQRFSAALHSLFRSQFARHLPLLRDVCDRQSAWGKSDDMLLRVTLPTAVPQSQCCFPWGIVFAPERLLSLPLNFFRKGV